jgi:hypothetical protein
VWGGRNEQRKRETNMGAVIVMLCGTGSLMTGATVIGGALVALGGVMTLLSSIFSED